MRTTAGLVPLGFGDWVHGRASRERTWQGPPLGSKTSGWFTLADMKQGLHSVGIGGRESRTGCLDVEKGESREYWKVLVQGPLGRLEGALRLSSARRLLHYQVPEPHPGAGGAQAECSVPVFL